MRKMGLDYGDRTIGVAVSDLLGLTAQGVEVIRRKKQEEDLARIGELIREYEVSELVVGLPKNMNGTIGPRGELCQEFAGLLKRQFGLPVHLWDERLTTVSATRTLLEADVSRKKRKQVVDKMAAALILQGYMDSKG
ncbi:Holliday junction resolvase RuvX [Paenibacillus larvae]|uniref:Putative pre-16S rRNA nuclease n=3 Tax=Paenibacillus larvae TaxID=1464 RepID=V9WA10_9BACL|nr:Holliday junction resolvase RuvX [Paenibacillus larvae]AHD06550.1 putative holliday junction resolvase [Paenibacillus larvae subsp. larvae DSM 25430]AQR77554.1 Holliday junction resolvase RuvX [Paenibacillus larvae subsp. larvae]AQT84017.1 Holliday junction resolvase RuvX [Paenibacillus larvae subsp. pulvifaciens]AQZ45477.1 Holliday junction resolvase RuvX [Paenibacillus larvae subsp. pulvifaciens]AVF21386.1 putative holliday junction resolvase [Paenibacillus larvae subsp. larvae]